jgi:hypothetical protein
VTGLEREHEFYQQMWNKNAENFVFVKTNFDDEKPAVSILLTTAKYWGPETVSWRGCPGGLGSLQFEENAFHSKERNIVFYNLPIH